MEFLILPGILLYVLLGWYLVYRDALPRMVKQAYEHIELYSSDETYKTRDARKRLVKEYKTWGLVISLFAGPVFPVYLGFMKVRDKILDVPMTDEERDDMDGDS